MAAMHRTLSLLAVAALLLAEPATAASRCERLGAELARLKSAPAASARGERFRIAAEQQRAELAATERMARRAGCAGPFAEPSAYCYELVGLILQMRGNLTSLERVVAREGGRSDRRVAQVRAEIAVACAAPRLRTAKGRPDRSTARIVPVALPVEKPTAAGRIDPALSEQPAAEATAPAATGPGPGAAGNTRVEDWQIPDADASTVPGSEDAAAAASSAVPPPVAGR